MWRYPFGSGGKRVTTSECFPAARSASMIWRMKLVGRVSSIAWRLPLSLLETGGQPSRSVRLAGAVGIEPTNGGVRARCLTVWRRPKRQRRLLRPVAAAGQAIGDGWLDGAPVIDGPARGPGLVSYRRPWA